MAIAFVQSGQHQNGGSGLTTCAVTLTNPVGAGNMLCISVGYAASGSTSLLSSITDDKSNTYTILDFTADTTEQYFWHSNYILNITNGAQVITAHLPAAPVFASILVDEFSGVLTAAAIDGHLISARQVVSAGANTITSGNITTTTNGDLIYSAAVDINGNSTAWSAGTGFALRQNITGIFATESQVQGTAGAIAGKFGFTTGTSQPYVNYVMAFKAAGGSTAPVGQIIRVNQAIKRASYF